jgi:hypothetical protein
MFYLLKRNYLTNMCKSCQGIMVLKLYPTTLATSRLIISFSQMLTFLEIKIPNKQKNVKKTLAWDAYENVQNMYI